MFQEFVLSNIKKASGCMFGLAIGDALAGPTEFLSIDQIVEKFGQDGPNEPAERVTDDTQLALAVAEALLETEKPFGPLTLERTLREKLIAWSMSPQNNRAPDATCILACDRLADGEDWIEATALSSKGNCANVRVAAVGLLPRGKDGMNERTRGAIAQFQAALTHAHPTALAASDLTSAAIVDLLLGKDVTDLTQRLRDYCESQRTVYHEDWLGAIWQRPEMRSPEEFISCGWDDCLAMLERIDIALATMPHVGDPCEELGAGWIAEEAFAAAMLCFLMHPDDPVAAIRRAAVTSGDSDSIAAITGALIGAHLGLDAWPADWIERIEYRERLKRIGAMWDRD
jgi:ADP-ribosylglycohydrolase